MSSLIELDASPQPDENAKNQSRQSRFRIRQRVGGVLGRIADTHK